MTPKPVHTPLSGPRATIRIPDTTHWEIRLRPQIATLVDSPDSKSLDAQVGPGRLRLVTGDPHLCRCFRESFPEAKGSGDPAAVVYAIPHLDDETLLRRIFPIEGGEAMAVEVALHEQEVEDPYIRRGLPPEALASLSGLPPAEAARRALGRPLAFFRPEERAFLLINSNDYGEVRARGVLGGLEAFLTESIAIDPERRILHPDESHLLLHGAVISLPGRGGMVFIGPEGSGKRTVAQGLHRWRDGCPFVPGAALIVHLGDRRISCPETKLFVGTDLGRIAPDLADPISAGTVENPDPPGTEGLRGRALLDPARLPGGPGLPEGETVVDIAIVVRDYDETVLIREITFKEAMATLTSGTNAPVYDPEATDVDGYGVLQGRRAEPYFNPCILQVEIDAAQGQFGEMDRKRIASYLHLAREGGVRFLQINPRLSPPQMQLCIRRFLAGEADRVDLLKARDAPDDLVWSLGLKKQSKPPAEGRREVDRFGNFREKEEAEVVAFREGGAVSDLIAFSKEREGRDQVIGYSRADLDFFFKTGAHLGLDDLFP